MQNPTGEQAARGAQAAVEAEDLGLEPFEQTFVDYSGLNLEPYRLDRNVLAFVDQFPNDPVPTYGQHLLRQARVNEYESYLAMMPERKIVTQGRSRTGASSRSIPADEGKAVNRLYNRIALKISDYEIDEAVRLPDGRPLGTGAIMRELDAQQEITIEGASEEDLRIMLGLGEREALPESLHVFDLIPTTDKIAAIAALAAGTIQRKSEGRAKRLGAVRRRRWEFHHLIGQTRQGNGNLTEPKHLIIYEFEEWDRKTFNDVRSHAFPTERKPLPGGGGVEVITQTQLRHLIAAFRKTIREMRGAVVNVGTEDEPNLVPVDVRDDSHHAHIPPAFIVGATTRMFLDMEADLKN